MLVTLFTDASWCPNKLVAGWGMWAKSERGKTEGGGAISRIVNHINEAELMAAVNGIWLALERRVALPGDELLIQLDNTNVIDFLHNKRLGITELDKLAKEKFFAVVDNNKLIYRLKHVKAHRPSLASRNWCNDQADSWAKKGLRRARKAYSRGEYDGNNV